MTNTTFKIGWCKKKVWSIRRSIATKPAWLTQAGIFPYYSNTNLGRNSKIISDFANYTWEKKPSILKLL